MSAINELHSTDPKEQAADNGVTVELSDIALRNLTGFFDVLIQMDLKQKQSNKRGYGDDQGTVKAIPKPSKESKK